MSDQPEPVFSNRLAQWMGETSHRKSSLHALFLNQSVQALHEMKNLMTLQMVKLWENASETPVVPGRPALFDSYQLDEFGAGHVSACFGPAFAKYDGMQIPRIPNGDLKMMSRITAITGLAGDFSKPASIEVEYDVPPDAWYLENGVTELIPYSLLMEIALQPCGFLSAYLDTYALVPYGSFFFRNLDGSAHVMELSPVGLDLRGKTIITQAHLLTSVASGGTVIQKFQFRVSLKETGSLRQLMYQGESTFGYFSEQTMVNQVGLDGGRLAPVWIQGERGAKAETIDLQAFRTIGMHQGIRLPTGRMGFLNQVQMIPNGGRFGMGYYYAKRPVNPDDWFYPFHFTGDPVMPGSLGVECILEGLKAYALAAIPGIKQLGNPLKYCLYTSSSPTTWRYRGQVTPSHQQMELEVHIKEINQQANGFSLSGDASIWVDGLRIYEVKNVGIRIIER